MARKIIHRTRATSHKERLQLAVIELAGILDALVFFLSLTLISSEFRMRFLLSDWCD